MQLLQLLAQDEADDLIEKENKAAKKDLKEMKAKCIQEEKDKIGNSKKLSIGKLVNKCPPKPACPDKKKPAEEEKKADSGKKEEKKPEAEKGKPDISDLLKELEAIIGEGEKPSADAPDKDEKESSEEAAKPDEKAQKDAKKESTEKPDDDGKAKAISADQVTKTLEKETIKPDASPEDVAKHLANLIKLHKDLDSQVAATEETRAKAKERQ